MREQAVSDGRVERRWVETNPWLVILARLFRPASEWDCCVHIRLKGLSLDLKHCRFWYNWSKRAICGYNNMYFVQVISAEDKALTLLSRLSLAIWLNWSSCKQGCGGHLLSSIYIYGIFLVDFHLSIECHFGGVAGGFCGCVLIISFWKNSTKN